LVDTIFVAVGSRRAPKLRAVAEALDAFGGMLESGGILEEPGRILKHDTRFEVVGVDVPSGVGHTPVSRTELMAGARGRAEALVRIAAQDRERWSYFVGLEAGLEVVRESGRMAFLENWAYVADTAGRGAYGYSGGVLLPEALAAEVLDRGVELSVAIEAHAGERGVRDGRGAWGVLTGDLITRQDAVRTAVIHAFAPFFNAQIYAGA
jgi:non-canonical (house-cleaning) NTP pyrophosphatase